ncbi:hypothetical protein E2C01_052252 [Portunus trituberculatus]|uniref:Uncharacterized protein n=1 Tax=Portunus trituberculatus TaxID=210409 RepID=A0A5B7GL11_PORTR|nr:hypothetical protein [Portunus trituberculatus]
MMCQIVLMGVMNFTVLSNVLQTTISVTQLIAVCITIKFVMALKTVMMDQMRKTLVTRLLQASARAMFVMEQSVSVNFWCVMVFMIARISPMKQIVPIHVHHMTLSAEQRVAL